MSWNVEYQERRECELEEEFDAAGLDVLGITMTGDGFGNQS